MQASSSTQCGLRGHRGPACWPSGARLHPPAVWHTQRRSSVALSAAIAAEAQDTSHAQQQPGSLESACSVNKGCIGLNPQGYRGLIATCDIAAGDVVLSLPLHNMLLVPRQLTQPHVQAAVAAALDAWQQQHGQLPQQLVTFLLDPEVLWEAKSVALLLYLKAAAPEGSLWHSYCKSLPAEAEAATFCSYSEQHAEQLQFSVWKDLANKQRELLQTVQQKCQAAGLQDWLAAAATAGGSSGSGGSGSGSSKALQQQQQQQLHLEYSWALSMVKSRTFGQRLPQPQQQDPKQQGSSSAGSSSGPAATAAAAAAAAGAAAAAAHQELEMEDEGRIVLLMAPFVDMINHAPNNNCAFGIDPSGTSFTVTCSSSAGISAGEELTISYGSNKSNLALLSCYGFFIPGNPNDAQLLSPIFNICLAAAGDLPGLPAQLLQQAADLVSAQQQQQQQHAFPQGNCALLQPGLVAARRQCALQAIPTAAQPPDVDNRQQLNSQQQQQKQKYLAQLMLYQLDLIFKRCGTSWEQDLDSVLLQQGASGSSDTPDAVVQQQVLLARLEHKLLLQECRSILQAVLQLLDS